MSRMLAALKKLEETGQFVAPSPVTPAAAHELSPPAAASPAGEQAAPRSVKPSAAAATSVLAPPAPPCELAEEFSGDPAEDYGRDLQCIEEQLAWAEALRNELLAEEEQETRADEEAAKLAAEEARREAAEQARWREEEAKELAAIELAAELAEEEDDEEPTVLETPGWESQVVAALPTPPVEPAAPVKIESPQAESATPQAEAEPPWVARPSEPMPRREGPLKVPFSTPHAPAPPLQTQPTKSRPASTPPEERPERDEHRAELPAETLVKAPAPVAPAEVAEPERPLPVLPVIELAAPKLAAPLVAEEARLPAKLLAFGPPLEETHRQALLSPATGEEAEQLAATCDRLLALLAERDARVCLLSSVGEGEEAARLAMQLAMQAVDRVESRVLVIEGDLERRRISRATVDPAEENNGLRSANEACVLPGLPSRLMLLPAAESEAPEAYRKRILAHLCRHLGRYSLVLVEGGGEYCPEIPEIAGICDAAVLHVPLGQVGEGQAQAALGKLHSWGVTVVGTVVTGASAAEAGEALQTAS